MTRPTRLLAALTLMVPLLAGCGDSSTRTTEVNPEAGSGDVGISAPEVDLHTAVISGDTDAVRQHIQAGSDLNVADPFGGSSPLITAATFGRTAIARLLIEAGADVNFTNADGATALHSAAFFCRPDIVDALLDAGIDKSIVNNYGSSAYTSVAGPFDQVKPFYDAMAAALAPMGLTLDYDYLRQTRPAIAAKLQ